MPWIILESWIGCWASHLPIESAVEVVLALKRISIIGNGAWGTALAFKLLKNHHRVILWGRNARQLYAKNAANQLELTTDWQKAVHGVDGILICVSSGGFLDIVERLKASQIVDSYPQSIHKDACGELPTRVQQPYIAWATKGFCETINHSINHSAESQTMAKVEPIVSFDFFSEVIEQQLHCQGCFITGPSFAQEVIDDKPTALVVAGEPTLATFWVQCLHHKQLRIYMNNNPIAAQIGAGMKNIIAIAVGVADGLELGCNARAALITRGLKEVERVIQFFNADAQTLYGLSGLGDIILTSTSDFSRNRRFGIALAQQSGAFGDLAEGANAVKHIQQLAVHHQLDLPITEAVYDLIVNQAVPSKVVESLLQRASVEEFEPIKRSSPT